MAPVKIKNAHAAFIGEMPVGFTVALTCRSIFKLEDRVSTRRMDHNSCASKEYKTYDRGMTPMGPNFKFD